MWVPCCGFELRGSRKGGRINFLSVSVKARVSVSWTLHTLLRRISQVAIKLKSNVGQLKMTQ